LIDNLRDCYNSSLPENEYKYISQTTLNQIVLNLKYNVALTVKEKLHSNSELESILLYIDKNPTLPLSISHLAKKFNCSPSWIAHSFKKNLNISPSQYISRKKITYAQSLINMGIPPVQVAEMCSYINYTTFYRQYKKYLGLNPVQDRKTKN
jgi:YesN/AraC family two-component response regulator